MMPQVRQPADSALDNLRLGQAPPDDLPTIRASLEPAEALVGELGPSVPLAERPNLASYWSLTRGLPLNAPAGGPALAQARRAWANQFLADHKEFDTVAEFDSGGRVVFLEPYAKQLTLRQFLVRELSSVDSLSVPHRATLLIHAPWYSSAAKASFVIPVYRRDGRRILAFTLKDSISPPDSNGPLRATVFDAAGNIAIDMATGSGGAPTHYENVVARSLAVAIGVHLPRSSPPPPDYFPMGALWLATIASGAIAASVPRMALASTKSRLAHARSTLRHIVSTARKESLDSTQTLAHDFSNSLLEVKSVAMAADGISIEDARRLNSAIGDLEGYLEQAQQSSRQLLVGVELTDELSFQFNPYDRGPLVCFVRAVVESQAAAHRSVLRGHIAPKINPGPDGDRDLFAAVRASTLKRIVGNVVHNGAEACSERHTDPESRRIEITASAVNDAIQIDVSDNGGGIEEGIAPKIFAKHFSTKGPNRGKGLAAARQLADAVQGSVELTRNDFGNGATFRITVPRAAKPAWFVGSVPIVADTVLVMVDDEGYVFRHWEKSLEDYQSRVKLPADYRPRLVKIKDPQQLIDNIDNALQLGTVFLIDYEFKNSRMNGADLIAALDLSDRAILVTNHFERQDVSDAVRRLNLKLMPKSHVLDASFSLDLEVRDE